MNGNRSYDPRASAPPAQPDSSARDRLVAIVHDIATRNGFPSPLDGQQLETTLPPICIGDECRLQAMLGNKCFDSPRAGKPVCHLRAAGPDPDLPKPPKK